MFQGPETSYTPGDPIYDYKFWMGESTLLDDYHPFPFYNNGLLFDGLQFLMNRPVAAAKSGGAHYITLADRENLVTIEAWFRLNDLAPQGQNIGWLYL